MKRNIILLPLVVGSLFMGGCGDKSATTGGVPGCDDEGVRNAIIMDIYRSRNRHASKEMFIYNHDGHKYWDDVKGKHHHFETTCNNKLSDKEYMKLAKSGQILMELRDEGINKANMERECKITKLLWENVIKLKLGALDGYFATVNGEECQFGGTNLVGGSTYSIRELDDGKYRAKWLYRE